METSVTLHLNGLLHIGSASQLFISPFAKKKTFAAAASKTFAGVTPACNQISKSGELIQNVSGTQINVNVFCIESLMDCGGFSGPQM